MPTSRPPSTTGTRSRSWSSSIRNASSRSVDASIVKSGGSAISCNVVVCGSRPGATTCETSVLRVTTPSSLPSPQTSTARTAGSDSRSPAACALSVPSSAPGSGTIASRTCWLMGRPAHERGKRHKERAEGERPSWVDPPRLQRSGHLVDPRHEGGLTQRDSLLLGQSPDAVERVGKLLGEARTDLVARPEQAAEVLHPLEV